MKIKREEVLVICEEDLSDGDVMIIGVAATREDALIMINDYYGIGEDGEMSNFQDIRDSGIDFTCLITVSGFLGGIYEIRVRDFIINEI